MVCFVVVVFVVLFVCVCVGFFHFPFFFFLNLDYVSLPCSLEYKSTPGIGNNPTMEGEFLKDIYNLK